MSKAIKFNLLLDKHPVRDLDDLRAHFNLDDLLAAYHSQLLQRWLEVRGLATELSQLQAITSKNDLTIASTLCQVFHENIGEETLRAAVYPFEFRKERQQRLEQLANRQFQRQAVIDSYHAGYEQLCKEMLEITEDYPFLKAAVQNLWADYLQLLAVDFDWFFALFIEKCPLALFTMLANGSYRQSELFSELFDAERKALLFSVVPNRKITREKKTEPIGIASSTIFMHSSFFRGIEEPLTETAEEQIETNLPLPAYFRAFAGVTDGYWKDLEPQGTQCLILKMENGNLIRNAAKNGEEFNAEMINKQFLILDGIDYKSNDADHDLIYMVV